MPAPDPVPAPRIFSLKRLRPHRLHSLIAVLGALMFVMIIGAHTWYNVEQQTEAEAAAVEARVKALADNLAAASAALLVTRRYSEIEDLLARIARFPDVRRIQLTNPTGEVLADIERVEGGEAQLVFEAARLQPPSHAQMVRGSEDLIAWQPVTAGAVIGWVRIEYSLQSIQALRASIVGNGILVGSLSIALGALLFWIALRQPMQAIERATRFAARLDQLRGQPYSVDRGIHEVEQLGEALNHVSLKLAQQEHALSTTTRRLRSVLQYAIDGIVTVDQAGRIESINPAAEHIFGYREEEILGHPFSRLVPGFVVDTEQDGDSASCPVRETQTEAEMLAFRKDGSSFPMHIGLSTIYIDDGRLHIGIVRDITEQKQLEHMKNNFVSSVSHELRTPLTALHGAISLLASGEVEGIGERAQPFIKLANKNSLRLVRLINDILDFEKLESGAVEFDARVVELAPLINQAAADVEDSAKLRSVRVVLPAPPLSGRVFADPARLTRVFVNLLASAVQLSPPHEEVHVGLRRVNDRLRVSVTHQGPGIPDEAREHIFQKFLKANIQDPHYQAGIGVSLSLAKTIVDRLAGRMDFESQAGATTFFVELPEASFFIDSTPATA